MFWRMIAGSLFRQKGKMAMIAFTIALGASLSSAMLNTMLGVGDKVNQELKTYGANINVVHKEASLLDDIYGVESGSTKKYLHEDELYKIKTIFWAYNIVDYAPFLNVAVTYKGQHKPIRLTGTWFDNTVDLHTGQKVITGIRRMRTWWEVSGNWASDTDDSSCMLGSLFAGRNAIHVGDVIEVQSAQGTASLKVSGIFNSGSNEDEYIFTTLHTAQRLLGKTDVCESI